MLVDDRVADDMPPGVIATHSGGLNLLLDCDVVVKAPGISIYNENVEKLESAGVAVAGGLGLWLTDAERSRVLCVTGTKGKSTTSSFAGHLLRQWGYSTLVGGNIGHVPWDPLIDGQFDYWVIEVSSYQAASLPVSTPVVVVTSLSADHLPWHHGDVETYYHDKLSVCSLPGARVTIANGMDRVLVAHAELLGPDVHWIRSDGEPEVWVRRLQMLGAHNRMNAQLAVEGLREMGVPQAHQPDALEQGAATFVPLAHRLQLVHELNGVQFVDDGLSTNVLPTIAAVESFPGRRIALILGGQDRGIDYTTLGTHLAHWQFPLLVLTIPDSGPRIHREILPQLKGGGVTVENRGGLADAVIRAFEWARPDGIVLLSPAAPSFGRYRDYRERSAEFLAVARSLGD